MKRPRRAFPVVAGDKDPDLSPGPLLDAIRSADSTVTGRFDILSEQWNPKPAVKSRRQATIWCDACAPRGTKLAEVWATSQGPLFRAELVYSYRDSPTPEPPDPVLMVHPTLPGEIAQTSRKALERVHSKRGWIEAPEGSKAPDQWKPNRAVLVRDLLEAFPEEEHPPLRLKCRRGHGEAEVDRVRLLSTLQRSTTKSQQIQLSDVRVS